MSKEPSYALGIELEVDKLKTDCEYLAAIFFFFFFEKFMNGIGAHAGHT